MSVSYINDYPNLAQRGWKVYADGYYKGQKKDDLIDQIRCLEHNWAGEIWGNDLLRRRLENACNYLKQQGLSLEEVNKIISVEGENR